MCSLVEHCFCFLAWRKRSCASSAALSNLITNQRRDKRSCCEPPLKPGIKVWESWWKSPQPFQQIPSARMHLFVSGLSNLCSPPLSFFSSFLAELTCCDCNPLSAHSGALQRSVPLDIQRWHWWGPGFGQGHRKSKAGPQEMHGSGELYQLQRRAYQMMVLLSLQGNLIPPQIQRRQVHDDYPL